MQDYWRGGWANSPMGKLPGTQAAAMSGGQYGPLNAIADIIGAIWQRNKERGEQKALEELYNPVDVNTSDTVSTPQFGDMSVSSLVQNNGQTPQQKFNLNPYTQGNNAMMDDAKRMGFDTAALQNFQNAAPAQFGSDAWYQQKAANAPAAQQAQPMQQVGQQQSAEAPGQYTPPNPQGETDGLAQGFQSHNGVTMDNGRVGCAEAVGKIGSWYSPFLKEMADKKVYWVPDMVAAAGDRVVPFDPNNVERGDVIVYGQDQHHVMIADGKGGVVGNSSNALGEDGPGAVVHSGNIWDYGEPSQIIKTGQDLKQAQGGWQAQQPQYSSSSIQMPQAQRYRPEQKQLHQSAPEQPWTEQYNSKERVVRAYDDAWAKKMKFVMDKAPELLQDREMMATIMAMREKGKQQLLEDWDKTENRRNWDEFQTAMANGDYNKALFLGYKNGLDPNAMKVLMSPDYESQLMDFGGEQKIISKNRYTGDIRVNGNAPTTEDLAMTLTPAQREQLALEREKFAHTVDMDNARLAMASERASSGGGGGGRSSGGGGGRSSSGGSSNSGSGYSRQEVANANYAIKRHKEWMRANKGADETESPFYDAYVEGQRIVDEAHGIQQNDSGRDEGGDDDNVSAGQAIAEYQGMLNSGASYDDVVAQVQEDFDEEDAERIISALNPNDYGNQFGSNNYRFAPINNIKGGFGAFNLLG